MKLLFGGFLAIASVSLPRTFCLEIASPWLLSHILGLRVCGDFRDIGRRIDFERNFDQLPFTLRLVASFGPSHASLDFMI